MDETFSVKDQLLETYNHLVSSVAQAAPRVLTGIILVLLALVVAKVIEKVLRGILSRAGVDAFVERIGLQQSLKRLGITHAPSFLLPRIFYFLLLFLFAQTLAQVLGLEPISQALGSFLAYLPNLVAALLLMIVGSLAGQFAGGAATRAGEEAGIDYAKTLGNLVSMLILFVSGIMALTQLKLHTDIIKLVTLCGLAGIALAFGLSFGLGTRDVTRNIVAGFYAKKLLRPGEPLEVRGEKGVLKAITPTQMILDQEGRTIVVSNSVILEETLRQ